MKSDYVIVGGGLVGLSAAYQILQAKQGASLCVLEKESAVASHQSTRNSGVIHTGIYYKPGTFKARLCVEGRLSILAFAQQHEVTHSICGKLIVATSTGELQQIKNLHQRAQSNGVNVTLLSPEQIKDREPFVEGVGGLWVPDAGVIDFAGLAQALVKEITRLGGQVLTNAKLSAATRTGQGWILSGNFDLIHAGYVVNCAGLHSDSVARKFGDRTEGRIVPFRGEYYVLRDSARKLCNTLIYPVPDPRFPFLGVHFTLTIDGKVKIGPTAIPIAGREQYSFTEGWSGSDIAQALKGMKSLVTGDSHDFGAILKSEWPKIIQKLLVKESTGLVPSAIKVRDWHRKPPGIRAQLVHMPTGKLEQDFIVTSQANATHVLNAVSPGWTSAITFGAYITERIKLS